MGIKTYLVLGMHRGGTSLTAGMVQAAGIKMLHGAPLVPTKESPDGYFEDAHIMRLNDRILRVSMGSWFVPPHPDAVIKTGERMDNIIKKILQPMVEPLWGLKDPRICLTYPALAPYLPNPQFIIVARDRKANFKAFKKTRFHYLRDPQRTEGFFNNIYKTYHDRAKEYAKGHPKITVKFEKFFTGTEEVERLHKFLKTDIPIETLAACIKSKYKHH